MSPLHHQPRLNFAQHVLEGATSGLQNTEVISVLFASPTQPLLRSACARGCRYAFPVCTIQRFKNVVFASPTPPPFHQHVLKGVATLLWSAHKGLKMSSLHHKPPCLGLHLLRGAATLPRSSAK
jgi:hypothetical protein